MDPDCIEEQVCLIVEMAIGNKVKRSDNLKLVGADSLTMTEIMLDVEERFEIVVSDKEWAELRTVDDIITYIDGEKK
jgi:acyl carrier protein